MLLVHLKSNKDMQVGEQLMSAVIEKRRGTTPMSRRHHPLVSRGGPA